MDYNKIGFWLKGYLDAIQSGDEVSKAQLEFLIFRVKDLLSEIEENEPISLPKMSNDDDLPF